jgi:hypothetical protein
MGCPGEGIDRAYPVFIDEGKCIAVQKGDTQ